MKSRRIISRAKNRKYQLTLLITGSLWSLFPGVIVCSNENKDSILYSEILIIVLCGIVTSLVVGNLFRAKIQNSTGWRFFILLPPAVLATALIICGLLIPVALFPLGKYSGHEFDLTTVLQVPMIFLISAFTMTFPIFYPLTLGTNILIRKLNK